MNNKKQRIIEVLTTAMEKPEIANALIQRVINELDKPQPEPDYEAEFIKDWNEGKVKRVSDGKRMVPEREWVGLTDDEVDDIGCDFATLGGDIESKNWFAFYLAIEAKLKEKNSG